MWCGAKFNVAELKFKTGAAAPEIQEQGSSLRNDDDHDITTPTMTIRTATQQYVKTTTYNAPIRASCQEYTLQWMAWSLDGNGADEEGLRR